VRLYLSILTAVVCVAGMCAAAGYYTTLSAREAEPTSAGPRVGITHGELQAAQCDSSSEVMPEAMPESVSTIAPTPTAQ
jgi:hypothetical protein